MVLAKMATQSARRGGDLRSLPGSHESEERRFIRVGGHLVQRQALRSCGGKSAGRANGAEWVQRFHGGSSALRLTMPATPRAKA